MLQGCYEENASVEFKLLGHRIRRRVLWRGIRCVNRVTFDLDLLRVWIIALIG